MAGRILGTGRGTERYGLRLARTTRDLHAAQELRFLVFNLELNEGLERSFDTLRDADPFDAYCDHLLVEDEQTGTVVGTYRMQTGRRAAAGIGYYSAQEFDLSPFEPDRAEVVELGRACVHREHRNLAVISMLWRGVIAHARNQGCRYLIGCGSLPTVDEAEGAAAFRSLAERHLAEPRHRTRPLPGWACQMEGGTDRRAKVPALMRAYLSLGAKICGPPALDRAFGTIDFLTLLDLDAMDAGARRFLA